MRDVKRTAGRAEAMPYYRCAECALLVRSGRFVATICPRCSAPLAGADQVADPAGPPAAVSRRFAAEPDAAGAAREALETLQWDLEPNELHVAALLTTELIANSVEHSGTGPGASVRFDATLTDQRLRVEVGDEGPGFVPAPRCLDSPLDSHWGLHLVEQLSNRWGVSPPPRGLVWFELDRVAAAPALAAGSEFASG